MGYVAKQKSQMHYELGLLMPRLKYFATTLTGDEAQAQSLVRATHNHLLARMSKERGHTPLALWALTQMQKIWAARVNGKGGDRIDPRLFQPRSRINDGGSSARFAMRIAQLSPRQRGALHLVYGERLSYDEVAEIFAVPVSEIISTLAKSHAALAESQSRSGTYSAAQPTGNRASQASEAYGRGRAA